MTPEQIKALEVDREYVLSLFHRAFSSKGGKAKMANMTKKERSELGKKAVRIREEKRKLRGSH